MGHPPITRSGASTSCCHWVLLCRSQARP